MSRFFFLLFLSISIISCGGGGSSQNAQNPGIQYKNVPEDITFLD